MARTFIVAVLIGLLSSTASARQRGSFTAFISGYVLLPDESQHKAKGIEVRLMYGVGTSFSFGIPANISVLTEDDGHFEFMSSAFQIAAQRPGVNLFLNIRLEGYAEIFQIVKMNSADNILMLNRGPSDGIDLTNREPVVLTKSEVLRVELVQRYSELAVREYEQGLRDMLNHKTDSAIGHFQKSTKTAPNFFDAWQQLGWLQKDTGQFNDAERAFHRASEADPNSAEPLVGLGAVLLDHAGLLESGGNMQDASAEYSEAARQLKDAIAREPWSSDGNYYLGSALYKLNRFPDAESALQAAVAHVNPRQDARLMLVNIYIKQKRYKEALDQLDAYLTAVPDGPQRAIAEKTQAAVRKAINPR